MRDIYHYWTVSRYIALHAAVAHPRCSYLSVAVHLLLLISCQNIIMPINVGGILLTYRRVEWQAVAGDSECHVIVYFFFLHRICYGPLCGSSERPFHL